MYIIPAVSLGSTESLGFVLALVCMPLSKPKRIMNLCTYETQTSHTATQNGSPKQYSQSNCKKAKMLQCFFDLKTQVGNNQLQDFTLVCTYID